MKLSLIRKRIVAELVKNTPSLVESEGVLPCWQMFVTGPYLELNESISYPIPYQSFFFKIRFNIASLSTLTSPK